jgi:3-methylcrotonyl-CoA carboxylase alpha subunit
MEMELPMKYEIEIEDGTRVYEIKRASGGYTLSLDDNPEVYVAIEQLGGIYNILFEGKSFDAGCVDHGDIIEVEVAGERHLLRVMDPMKKALRLSDSASEGLIQTQMPGRIVEVCVSEGDTVEKGQIIIIVEAMKMENPLKAKKAGTVSSIYVKQGDLVEGKSKLALID